MMSGHEPRGAPLVNWRCGRRSGCHRSLGIVLELYRHHHGHSSREASLAVSGSGLGHGPDVARRLGKHQDDLCFPGGPTLLGVRDASVKMLRRKSAANRTVRDAVDPLSPKTVMAISLRGKVQRLSIRRPVGPVLGILLSDGDPFALGNGLRAGYRGDDK